MPTRLQLVIPCYNEASRLDADTFVRFVAARDDVRLLFVDDGSTDTTSLVLADIAEKSAGRVDTLVLPHNRGKAHAVQRGIIAAIERQPELVGYWDADLATPLDAVDEFLDVLARKPDVDIVIGSRVKLLGRRIDRHASRVSASPRVLSCSVMPSAMPSSLRSWSAITSNSTSACGLSLPMISASSWWNWRKRPFCGRS